MNIPIETLFKEETETQNLNSANEKNKNEIKTNSTAKKNKNPQTQKSAIKLNQEEINDSYIISHCFKIFHFKNNSYSRTTAKKLKIIFRTFLENLIEHELLMKSIKNKNIALKNNENNFAEEETNAAYKKKELNQIATEKTKNKFYYDKYKQRVLNQLEAEYSSKPEVINTTETQSNIINTMVSARRRNLKMEDVYGYQRKKREM